MQHDWILSVIADLEDYAACHDLQSLKISLEELRVVTTCEITLMTRIEAELAAVNGLSPTPKTSSCTSNVIAWPRRAPQENRVGRALAAVTTQVH